MCIRDRFTYAIGANLQAARLSGINVKRHIVVVYSCLLYTSLVVEVTTPSGHSSSYPPHKHDRDNAPVESSLEETYYHRLNPPQGFAFQRVYTEDRSIDESMAVEDNDVVIVPRGYHPVVVPYGYDSYYLNVMAGPRRHWYFKNDPIHEWMLQGTKRS